MLPQAHFRDPCGGHEAVAITTEAHGVLVSINADTLTAYNYRYINEYIIYIYRERDLVGIRFQTI